MSAIEIYLGSIEIWDPEAKNNAQAENSECQIVKIVPFQISGKPSKWSLGLLSLSNCVYSRQMNLCNSIHVSQMEKNVCLSSVWGQTPNSWWNLKRTETKWELRVRPAGSTPSFSSSVDSTTGFGFTANADFLYTLIFVRTNFVGSLLLAMVINIWGKGGTFVTLIFPFCGHFQWTGLRRSGILCCIWQLLMRHRAPGVSHLSPCGWWARYYPDLPPAEIEINSGPSKQ